MISTVLNITIPCIGAFLYYHLASQCNQSMSIAYDEVMHLVGAHAYWQPQENRRFTWLLNAENGVFPQLWCGIPAAMRWITPPRFPKLGETISSQSIRAQLARAFCFDMGNDVAGMLASGRSMSILAGCILVVLTYVAALRVHPETHAPAFAAAIMTALCPALLSQALVTSDLWSAVGFLAVAVSYDSLLLATSRIRLHSLDEKRGILSGLFPILTILAITIRLLFSAAALALLCLSKMSCVLAVPIQVAILAAHVASVAADRRPAAPSPAASGADPGPGPGPGLAVKAAATLSPVNDKSAAVGPGLRGPSAARVAALGAVLMAAQCVGALTAVWYGPIASSA
jgi:hypothetical protein